MNVIKLANDESRREGQHQSVKAQVEDDVLRPEGLWYLVFITPQSESRDVQPVFDEMLRSMRFSK